MPVILVSKYGGQLAFYKNVPTTVSRLSKVRIALPVVLAVYEKQENEQSVLTHNYIFAYNFWKYMQSKESVLLVRLQ